MLLLSDLQVVLPDLLGKKKSLFEETNTGNIYLPLLKAQLDRIDELPAGPPAGVPLAAQLAEKDVEHDGYGGAIWHLTEAYFRSPAASEEVRAAATRIRKQFIPKMRELQGTYAEEAQRARERSATLDEHKADLKLFPVAEKGTLYDWVKGFLEAGTALSELLSDRADTPIDSRQGAAALRAETLGLLADMRQSLRREVAANHKLPRDLVDQVFKLHDQETAKREAQRAEAEKTAAKKKAKATPPPPDAPAGSPAKG
jgi:hypothetical protein